MSESLTPELQATQAVERARAEGRAQAETEFGAANLVENAAYENVIADLQAENAVLLAENEQLKNPPTEPPVPDPEPPPDPGPVVGETRIDISKLPGGFFPLRSGKTYEKIVFGNDGTGPGPQGANAAVRPGSGNKDTRQVKDEERVKDVTIRHCTFENADCLLSLRNMVRAKVLNCELKFAGQLCLAISGAIDCEVKFNKIHHGNYGLSQKPTNWGLDTRGKPRAILIGGKWYALEGFEAGGCKFTLCTGLVFEGNEWWAHHGKSCWADIVGPPYNKNIKCINEYYHHNVRVGNVSWGGYGLNIERLIGSIEVIGGKSHDNEGPGIAIEESRNVTIKGFNFGNDPLWMRNLLSRRPESGVRNILVEYAGNAPVVKRDAWAGTASDAALNIIIRKAA